MRIVLLFLLVTGCTHVRTKFDNNVAKTKDGKLESTLNWLKVKNRKMDVSLTIENKTEAPMFMEQNAVRVIYNGVKSSGSINGNQGQVIPGQSQVTEVVTISFPKPVEAFSTGKVIISPFYDYKGGKKGENLGKLIHEFKVVYRRPGQQ